MPAKTGTRSPEPKRDPIAPLHPPAARGESPVTLRRRVATELETLGEALGTSPRAGFYFLLGVFLIILGFLLYIQFFLIGRMREEARAATRQYGFYYRLAAANSVDDPEDLAFIFEKLRNPSFPVIVTEPGGEVIQYKIPGISFGDTSLATQERLRAMIPAMDAQNEPVEVVISASPLLKGEDLRDPAALAKKLRDAVDPVSRRLRDLLPPDTQRLLDEYSGGASPSELLRYALVSGLNQVIQKTALYAADRFSGVGLGERTLRLLRRGAKGEDLARLNRLLLEDAYPEEIAREETPEVTRWVVHYGDSDLIRQLAYLPFVALGIVALFMAVSYLGYRNIRNNEQRSIWVGMTKETAHQLGTPLSSLFGWLELLKADGDESDGGDPDRRIRRLRRAIDEMERDLGRINKVVSRFSQIGSVPELTRGDLNAVIQETAAYLRARIPRIGREVRIVEDYGRVPDAPINRELLGWAFENLMKNALDALEDREGVVRIVTRRWDDRFAEVLVSDNGKGIDPRHYRRIFSPGYSTKKRGWGLGLTFVKRIVEEYHRGRISVLESAPNLGTTFRILLPIQAS